jgi:endo-1,3(4)-beta-glucanase
MTTDRFGPMSVNVNLVSSLPLVQGIGFISRIYTSVTVLVQYGIFFKQFSPVTKLGSSYKWIILLQDAHQWAVYITPNPGDSAPELILDSENTLRRPGNFNGLVQIAKLENQAGESIFDAPAGVYTVPGSVFATASGSYSITWSKKGDTSKKPIMFALPHHIQSFDGGTSNRVVNIQLQTPTKGIDTTIVANIWAMVETLPTSRVRHLPEHD